MSRLVALFLFTALTLSSQTNRGGIAGSITDQSQAVVPGAAITVTNIGTNEVRKFGRLPIMAPIRQWIWSR